MVLSVALYVQTKPKTIPQAHTNGADGISAPLSVTESETSKMLRVSNASLIMQV